MFFPIFTSVVAFCLLAAILRRNADRKAKQQEEEFWNREKSANLVPRKSLDNLEYIRIPYEELPTDVGTDSESVASCLQELNTFREKKIVNLQGMTNTDLKLTYGTLNLTVLTEYDTNFLRLVALLQKWAFALNEENYRKEAYAVCDFAIRIGSDISKTYHMMGEFLCDDAFCPPEDRARRLEELSKRAEALPSLMRNTILRDLEARKAALSSDVVPAADSIQ